MFKIYFFFITEQLTMSAYDEVQKRGMGFKTGEVGGGYNL